jgi:hypothetical protein
MRRSPFTVYAIIAVILTIAATVSAADTPASDAFIASYWYGPPPKFTTIEQYRRIKEAGFNVVMPPGPPDASITIADNRKILDFCRDLEMKAIIFDPRMPKSLAATDAKAKIDAIVKDYADHPALMAYFIVDEPSANHFAELGAVVAYLKERDPKHPGYMNLFPIHAALDTQLAAPSYEQYVDQFIEAIDPFVISYDHYPFAKHGDNPGYFTNLAVIRNAGITSSRPFWNIAQLVQHYDYRALTEPELRFQAMQTLAFGGRGLLWYTYWYPGDLNPTVKHAMINHDGTPDPSYAWISRINADARAIGNELAGAQCWATFHTGDAAQYAAPPKTSITLETTGRLTTGVFTTAEGGRMAMVTNRDYRNDNETGISVEPAGARIELFDPGTGSWSALEPRRIALPAGDGVLLRW